MTQNAEIVERIVKYHSDQRKTDLYIAENASQITDNTNKLFLYYYDYSSKCNGCDNILEQCFQGFNIGILWKNKSKKNT